MDKLWSFVFGMFIGAVIVALAEFDKRRRLRRLERELGEDPFIAKFKREVLDGDDD